MINPFRFGEIISNEHFTNRTTELKNIIHTINSGQNIILISPRRFGKSSLIKKAVSEVSHDSITIDLELVNSDIELANLFIKKLIANHPLQKIKQLFANFQIKPSLKFSPDSSTINVDYEASVKDVNQYCLDAFNLADTLSSSKKKIVVVLDEFQEIRRINKNLERTLRGIFQNHQNVCYIFIGSNRRMISDIFQNTNNPFYKFGKIMTLGKIPEKDFSDYLEKRFSTLNINSTPIIKNILNITQRHPYYTQQLAHEIFNLIVNNTPLEGIVNKAISSIIINHNAEFHHWWTERNTTERKILVGLSENKYSYGSKLFLDKYQLNATSTVTSSMKHMYTKNVLELDEDNKYYIEDIFFKEWILYRRSIT